MKTKFVFLFLIISISCFSQWEQCPLYGGSVISLAMDSNYIYAGTFQGGIYVSADYGQTWQSRNNGLPKNTNVYSILIRGNDVFIGTNGNIYKSTDHGNNWFPSSSGIPFQSGEGVISIIQKDSLLFISFDSGEFGVYKSIDNGLNWQASNNGFDSIPMIISIIANDSAVFAGSNKGIYKSIDNGNHWFLSNNGLPNSSYLTCFSFLIKDSMIFASIRYGESNINNGVYKSTDGGNYWTISSNGIPYNSYP